MIVTLDHRTPVEKRCWSPSAAARAMPAHPDPY